MRTSTERIVLLTGDGLRHRFLAARLARDTNLVGMIVEPKAPILPPNSAEHSDDERVIAQHLAERDAVEHRLLGTRHSLPDTEIVEIRHGAINSPTTLACIQRWRPDSILLFGTGIIRPPLLDMYAGRMINLHLGLSPYYRGSGTNFWPFVNREPECVGATIHLAVQSVDAGGILVQVRPAAEPTDRVHELGTRAIIAASDSLPAVIELLGKQRIEPCIQDLSRGRVYRKRDFNAEAVRTAWHNLDDGMMSEYLGDLERRCNRYPIHQFHHAPA